MAESVRREIPLPLSPDIWAHLTVPCPLTEAEWAQMMTVLEAMRPALVETAAPARGETP